MGVDSVRDAGPKLDLKAVGLFRIVAVIGAFLGFLGTLSPWLSIFAVSINGVSLSMLGTMGGLSDVNPLVAWSGVVTVTAAYFAGSVLLLGKARADRLAVALGLMIAVFPMLFIVGMQMEWNEGPSTPGFEPPSIWSIVGVGVYMSIVGGILVVVGSTLQLRENSRKAAPAASVEVPTAPLPPPLAAASYPAPPGRSWATTPAAPPTASNPMAARSSYAYDPTPGPKLYPCPYCGTPVPDMSPACTSCGQPLVWG